MKPIASFLLSALLLMQAVSSAQEPGGEPAAPPAVQPKPGADEADEGPPELDPGPQGHLTPTRLVKMVLDSEVVVLGRCTGVARAAGHGAAFGDFLLTIRVERVLKGVLGPVLFAAAAIPGSSASDYRALMDSIFDQNPASFVLFFDVTERFKTTPLFRMAALAEPGAASETVEIFVAAQARAAIAALSSESAPERETAFTSLVKIGSPALDMIETARSSMSPESASTARAVMLRVREKRVDPGIVVQPNSKYPHEPVEVFTCPELMQVSFKLPPGCTVFRLESHETDSRKSVRIRTADGREGWIRGNSCADGGR